MGWFCGFKLHLVVDLDGNILNAYLTSGNCDDREPVEKILQGVICGDRGYISKNLFKKLWEKGTKYEKQVNVTGGKNFGSRVD